METPGYLLSVCNLFIETKVSSRQFLWISKITQSLALEYTCLFSVSLNLRNLNRTRIELKQNLEKIES